jgi:hypothetical protein
MERLPHQVLVTDAPKRNLQITLSEEDYAAFQTLAHSLEWTKSELGRRCVGFYIEDAKKRLAPLAA